MRLPRIKVKRGTLHLILTRAMGALIPILSLTTTHVGGTLFRSGHLWVAAFVALVGLASLSVSLGHVAGAIRTITGSTSRVSWSLAVAFDLSLVAAELTLVTASDTGLTLVCWCIIVSVGLLSAALNTYAFEHHK